MELLNNGIEFSTYSMEPSLDLATRKSLQHQEMANMADFYKTFLKEGLQEEASMIEESHVDPEIKKHQDKITKETLSWFYGPLSQAKEQEYCSKNDLSWKYLHKPKSY